MTSSQRHCAQCGQPAEGNFCSTCGAPLVATGSRPNRNPATVAWSALGIAAVALVVALASMIDRQLHSSDTAPFDYSSAPAAPAAMESSSVDLSTMTPRQAADRLFNRVMAADERGDKAEATRFAPMALQAYGILGELDGDARYHVALLHLTAGDAAGAREQLAALRKSHPDHLLAYMIEHQLASRGGEKAKMAKTSNAFLAAYDKEIVKPLAEYRDHRGNIDRFRDIARVAQKP